jgi:hypothetical protein
MPAPAWVSCVNPVCDQSVNPLVMSAVMTTFRVFMESPLFIAWLLVKCFPQFTAAGSVSISWIAVKAMYWRKSLLVKLWKRCNINLFIKMAAK